MVLGREGCEAGEDVGREREGEEEGLGETKTSEEGAGLVGVEQS